MNLSQDQEKAYRAVMEWYRSSDRFFVLAGYAGTGKTTLAKIISDQIGQDNVVFCALSGKAASILREKGCQNSGTIHSFLYQFRRENNGKPEFGLRPKFGNAKLVIVDEFSMLNDEIIKDINNNASKVLYLGDTFQLPPVSNRQTLLHPNLLMEKIQRQANDSPILRFATKIRNGEIVNHCDEGEFKYVRRGTLTREQFLETDQFICGRNLTREDFNLMARKHFGYDGRLPKKNEKIIIVKNNPKLGVFNGMTDIVSQDAKLYGSDRYVLPLKENGLINVYADPKTYNHRAHHDLTAVEFAYALTCHKSQGSEFDNVIVYNEPTGQGIDAKRWLYTAATRAKKTLILTDARIRN